MRPLAALYLSGILRMAMEAAFNSGLNRKADIKWSVQVGVPVKGEPVCVQIPNQPEMDFLQSRCGVHRPFGVPDPANAPTKVCQHRILATEGKPDYRSGN